MEKYKSVKIFEGITIIKLWMVNANTTLAYFIVPSYIKFIIWKSGGRVQSPFDAKAVQIYFEKNFGIYFFAQSDLKIFFGPIPWQAAEIIGGLLATESQSHRVTELQSYRHPRVLSIHFVWNLFVPDFN